MGNPFFYSLKYWPKLLPKQIENKSMEIYISSLLWNQFWTSGSGKTKNTKIRLFAYFQFDPFPKSKIDLESRFEMRTSIFLFKFNFYLKSFRQ